jgi:hypothetical protein
MDSGCKWIQDIKNGARRPEIYEANEDLQQFNLYTHNIYHAIPNKKITKNKPGVRGYGLKPSLSTGEKMTMYKDGKKVASVGDAI